ncbi:uncharacterized protein LOC134449834 [Engraulis encrasicolus]|uniref:uncharacterized protein LOC134449834 n=1 Tax=Engraulis encrasicolus TaxID=184585 RepID=UPI002FD1ABE2
MASDYEIVLDDSADGPPTIDTEDEDFKEIINSHKKNSKSATSKVMEKLEQLENVILNVAITGNSGAGKSSYVNAIRGVRDDDEGSAATGVTETTMTPLMYPHPTMPNVQIWDLPGIGSPKFKAKQYLKDVKFKTYDFFIIITSERFKENDIMLAKEIKRKKKLFYFVRSKIDNDIRSEMKKKNFDKQEVLQRIREDCKLNLQKVGDPKVFLVSSCDLSDYDFQLLIDTLETELPMHKRLALLQSLPVCSLAMIDKKKKALARLIWLIAFGSSTIAMAPVPGLSFACDLGIMIAYFRRCLQALGLDDRSLSVLGERVNKTVEELKQPMTSRFKDGVSRKVVIKLFGSAEMGAAMTIEYILSTIPIAGTLAAGGISFGTIFHMLNKGLREMTADAKAVLTSAGLEAAGDGEREKKEEEGPQEPKEPEQKYHPVNKGTNNNMATDYENEDDSAYGSVCIDTEDEDVKEIINSYKKNSKESATSKVMEKLEQLENVILNIAITGNTGAGKSSFVNAIRGVRDDEDGSAATGVTETTMTSVMYPHPTMPNVQIWDLPGIGSPKFKAKQYLKDVKFKTYDFFIIITSERFKENDIMLAKEIKRKKKLFYFVRSKIDNDIRSEMKKKNFDKQKVLQRIREDCKSNLQKVGDPKVFLVASCDLSDYDFQLLIDTLEKELPMHKRLALLQSLPVCSLAMIDKKKKALSRLIWLVAFASSAIAMVPVPGLSIACDLGITIGYFQRCQKALGPDNRSLSVLGERVNKTVEELKEPMQSLFKGEIDMKVVIKFFGSVEMGMAVTIEYILSTVPVCNQVVRTGEF